ncbi:PASTA domain-containing protein [Streptomyces sp. NPDC051976]|uniref:PASTA domain-containing protein n=1 Tax=Streptomyces sp. NPDC051976 TaxID=3154947 RepID=UPI003448FF35
MSKRTLQRFVSGERLPSRDAVQHLLDLASEHLVDPPGTQDREHLWDTYTAALEKKNPVLHRFYELMTARDEALLRTAAAEDRSRRAAAALEAAEQRMRSLESHLAANRTELESYREAATGGAQDEYHGAVRAVVELRAQAETASHERSEARRSLMERESRLTQLVQRQEHTLTRQGQEPNAPAQADEILNGALEAMRYEYGRRAPLPPALAPAPGTTHSANTPVWEDADAPGGTGSPGSPATPSGSANGPRRRRTLVTTAGLLTAALAIAILLVTQALGHNGPAGPDTRTTTGTSTSSTASATTSSASGNPATEKPTSGTAPTTDPTPARTRTRTAKPPPPPVLKVVPDVIGMTLTYAEGAFHDSGFTGSIQLDGPADADIADGHVVSQSPEAGTRADPGVTVTLTFPSSSSNCCTTTATTTPPSSGN